MRRSLLTTALVLLVATAVGTPAGAAVPTNVGAVTFQGNAELETFPCPLPPNGDGPCTGTMQGGWQGSMTGETNGGRYEVVWARETGLSATFTYFEHQCVEPSTVLGGASGSGYAYAGPGRVSGTWQDASGLPLAITEVTALFDFDWSRVATGALLTFRSLRLYVNVIGIGWVRVASSAGLGTAVFVPLSLSEVHQPTCAQPVSISGTVVGDVPLTS